MSSEWPTVQLSDCAEFQEGYVNPSQRNSDFFDGPIKWLRAVDLNDSVVSDTTRTLSEKGFRSAGKSALLFEPGSLAISKSGTIGRLGILEDYMCGNRAVINIRVNHSICDKHYIFYVLKSKRAEIESLATGSVQKNLYTSVLGSMELDLPPLETQKAIASQLWSLDKKIQINHQINQTLEQMAQAIFKSWFVDFEPVKAKIGALEAGGSEEDALLAAMQAISGKGESEITRLQAEQPEQYAELRATAELFPSAMQNSELGEIPEGWEFQQLKTLCRVINGRAFKNSEFKESGTPIIRIQNLSGKGKTVYSDLDLPQDKLINKEDFIYAWSATFGPFIWRGERSIYHYHIWKMDVHEEVVSRYFMYLSMFRKTEQMKNAGTGSIFTHLTKKIMESQDILIGTPELNKKFSQMIEPIFLNISALHKESMHLQSLRDELLPKLISGELSVSEAEGQLEKVAEPANV